MEMFKLKIKLSGENVRKCSNPTCFALSPSSLKKGTCMEKLVDGCSMPLSSAENFKD